jgi:hypothetical protein
MSPSTPKKPAPKRPVAKTSKPAATMTSPDIDPAFAPVAAAFAKDSQVGLGKMFSSKSVLNVNGKIFAMLVKGRFVAKLPKERVDALVGSGAGDYFDPGHGRLMKEWVALADASTPWVALAKEAYAFVKAPKR